jgi:hypothetical protein
LVQGQEGGAGEEASLDHVQIVAGAKTARREVTGLHPDGTLCGLPERSPQQVTPTAGGKRMATMLVALALTLACIPQEASTEQTPDPLCDPAGVDAPRPADALGTRSDVGGPGTTIPGLAPLVDRRAWKAAELRRRSVPRAVPGAGARRESRAVVWCLEHQEARRRRGEPRAQRRTARVVGDVARLRRTKHPC